VRRRAAACARRLARTGTPRAPRAAQRQARTSHRRAPMRAFCAFLVANHLPRGRAAKQACL